MPHNDELSWDALCAKMSSLGDASVNNLTINRGSNRWWTVFKDGRSDADIATALGGGATAAKVAEVTAFFLAFKETYDFVNDVAGPVQGDRLADIRKFLTGR